MWVLLLLLLLLLCRIPIQRRCGDNAPGSTAGGDNRYPFSRTSKTLWGFRFVSKSWFNLLTLDSQFLKLHSDRSVHTNNAPSILALQCKPFNLRKQTTSSFYLATEYASCHKPTHLQLPFALDSNDYDILPGICNGLVCLSSPAKREVYIWNPLTNDHIVIPYLSSSSLDDPMDLDCFTLGFVHATNQYKLVRISTLATPQLSVYTLGVGSSWRNIDLYVPNVFALVRKTTQLVNGVLHWIVSCPQDMIVGFDLEDEVLRHIPTPQEADLEYLFCQNNFMEMDGLLCLCAQAGEEPIQIWVMKEYGVFDSWIKLFTIGCPEICQLFTFVKPLATHDGEIILMMQNGLILLNPETNSIRKIKGFKLQLQDAYAYVGSIVSPWFICGLQNII